MTHGPVFRISLAHTTPRDRERIRVLLAPPPAPVRSIRDDTPSDERRPWIAGDVLMVPCDGAMETFAALSASDDLRALAVAYRLLEEIERRDAVYVRVFTITPARTRSRRRAAAEVPRRPVQEGQSPARDAG